MHLAATAFALILVAEWAPMPAVERDGAAVNTCLERIAKDPANAPLFDKFVLPLGQQPGNTAVPSNEDLAAIARVATQARPCINLSRALVQNHLPQLAPAHAALEARIEIVGTRLTAQRMSYANAAFLLQQASGEFSSRRESLTQTRSDLEQQIDNDRELLALLRTTEQTADTADPRQTCHWRRALINCRPLPPTQ